MTITMPNTRVLTGVPFRDGRFQFKKNYKVTWSDAKGQDVWFKEYKVVFRLGEEFRTNFTIFQTVDSDLPKYLIFFLPIGVECDEGDEEVFFANSLIDLNGFLKEMQPMVETAKYLQAEYDKEED